MSFNIFINKIKVTLPQGATLKDIMNKFFKARCEFIININSEPLKNNKFETVILKENDNLQIIAYSRHSYSPEKIITFKEEKEKTK